MQKLPTSPVIQAWTRLLRAQHGALTTVEKALKAAGLPALDWYDVLLELDRAGAGGLRAFELQRELLLPQYGLSRLLSKIEAAGYLQRQDCEDDGRGQTLVITTSGKKLRRRMWPVYSDAINQAIGGRLTDKEAAGLSKLLDKLCDSPMDQAAVSSK